eukprot:1111870-Prorocentrum_minimum.AAC.2
MRSCDGPWDWRRALMLPSQVPPPRPRRLWSGGLREGIVCGCASMRLKWCANNSLKWRANNSLKRRANNSLKQRTNDSEPRAPFSRVQALLSQAAIRVQALLSQAASRVQALLSQAASRVQAPLSQAASRVQAPLSQAANRVQALLSQAASRVQAPLSTNQARSATAGCTLPSFSRCSAWHVYGSDEPMLRSLPAWIRACPAMITSNHWPSHAASSGQSVTVCAAASGGQKSRAVDGGHMRPAVNSAPRPPGPSSQASASPPRRGAQPPKPLSAELRGYCSLKSLVSPRRLEEGEPSPSCASRKVQHDVAELAERAPLVVLDGLPEVFRKLLIAAVADSDDPPQLQRQRSGGKEIYTARSRLGEVSWRLHAGPLEPVGAPELLASRDWSPTEAYARPPLAIGPQPRNMLARLS